MLGLVTVALIESLEVAVDRLDWLVVAEIDFEVDSVPGVFGAMKGVKTVGDVETVEEVESVDIERLKTSEVERLGVATETVFNEVEKVKIAEDEVINVTKGVTGIIVDVERVESDELCGIDRPEEIDVTRLEVSDAE